MSRAAQYGLHTQVVRSRLGASKANRPVSEPIIQSTTFEVASSRQMGAAFRDRADRIYSRFGNPTLSAVEARLALLENTEAALVFGSGMGAIVTSILAVLASGDHVVAQREIFAQTYTFLHRECHKFGIDTTFVDATRVDEVAAACRKNTKLIYVETPSNPMLKVIDIAAVATVARQRAVELFVDSTFASPYLQNPIALGATFTLHSATKFLGGHSDVTCGFAAGDRELIRRVHEMRTLLGTIQDPHAAWLVLRGMKTLAVRVQRQCESALTVARFLEQHPAVRTVHYPGLERSPSFAVASKQMRAGGGVLSFELDGDVDGARAVLDGLELIPTATSLGGVETLIEIPCDLDFHPDEIGSSCGGQEVSPALIRLSIGLEDPEDLIHDLDRALRRVSGRST